MTGQTAWVTIMRQTSGTAEYNLISIKREQNAILYTKLVPLLRNKNVKWLMLGTRIVWKYVQIYWRIIALSYSHLLSVHSARSNPASPFPIDLQSSSELHRLSPGTQTPWQKMPLHFSIVIMWWQDVNSPSVFSSHSFVPSWPSLAQYNNLS